MMKKDAANLVVPLLAGSSKIIGFQQFRERPDDILSQSGSQLTNYPGLNKVGFFV